MAMASLIQAATVRDVFKNAITLNYSATDVWKIALFKNACSPVMSTDPATYGSAPYNANEVTGTGWTAAQTLAGTACAITANNTVGIFFDATDVSVGGTTLGTSGAGNGVYGCAIYDDSATPKCVLMAISFGADYTTTNGTFAITWDALGLAQITLH